MALSIKHPEADGLARELAARTGESLTEIVLEALRQRLRRGRGRVPDQNLEHEIMATARRSGALPRRTGRSPTRTSATTSVACPADGRRDRARRGRSV